MGSVSPPGRHAMVCALREELLAVDAVIQQVITGNVQIQGDVSEIIYNAMENARREAHHVEIESVSVIRIQTAMVTGTIENAEIPVSQTGNHVKCHVLLVTTSASTLGNMGAMIVAFANTIFKEVTTNIVEIVISAHLATINVHLIRVAPVRILQHLKQVCCPQLHALVLQLPHLNPSLLNQLHLDQQLQDQLLQDQQMQNQVLQDQLLQVRPLQD